MDKDFRSRIMERIKKLRLMDDFFMTRFFDGNIECTELVLRIILDKDDLQVVKVETQATIKSLIGRGARLDVLAVDAEGKHYNIEVQRAKEGADFRRARFNSSMLDMVATKQGDKYEDIADTYVIFITEEDVLKGGLPIYEVGKVIVQTGQRIEDGAHVIYVNGAYVGNNSVGKLMADFRNSDYRSMNYEPLKQRSKFLKEDEKGANNMCAFSEELLAEGEARGRVEGEARGRVEGEARGRAEGEARGRIAAIVVGVRNMMNKMKMSADEAMDMFNVASADRPAILAAL